MDPTLDFIAGCLGGEFSLEFSPIFCLFVCVCIHDVVGWLVMIFFSSLKHNLKEASLSCQIFNSQSHSVFLLVVFALR